MTAHPRTALGSQVKNQRQSCSLMMDDTGIKTTTIGMKRNPLCSRRQLDIASFDQIRQSARKILI